MKTPAKIRTIFLSIILFAIPLLIFAQKPKATIVTPLTGKTYIGGEEIPFVGTGTDATDGVLGADAFRWIIVMNHGIGSNQHWHDGIALYDGISEGLFQSPIADDHTLSDSIFFRIYLVVKNSKGLRDTAYVDLIPKQQSLTIVTEPPGIKINLQGYGALTTPIRAKPTENMLFVVTAIKTQTVDGVTYTFKEWGDGNKNLSIAFNVPPNESTLKAIYTVVNAADERLESRLFNVYPNPSMDVLNIIAPESLNRIDLYSPSGQLVEDNLKFEKKDEGYTINTSRIPQGLYFLKILTIKGYAFTTFSKQ